MKKIYFFLFVALMMSQNVFAVGKEWTGSTNTDWATATNWSPNGVPTAADNVSIPNVANDPVVFSGTTATALWIDIGNGTILTINNGGALTVTTDAARNNRGINIFTNGTLTNNGTLTISTTTSVRLIVLNDYSTFNNSGTVVLKTRNFGILLGGPNAIVNNYASGVISSESFRIFSTLVGTSGNVITNQGTVNYSGGNYAIALNPGFTFNNSGTVNILNGAGIDTNIHIGGGTLNNLACGKILMSAGSIDNSATGSLITNAGLLINDYYGNTNGTFNNTGVVTRLPTTGTVTHTGDGAVHVQSNTIPIFNYGGAFNGTINGIFTDATATTSAGTFTAPNTFVPSGLPFGSQTLYAKITPSGAACEYIVPFTYFPKPVATTGAVSAQTPTSTTLNGTINPLGQPLTAAQFEVSTDPTFASFNTVALDATSIGTGNTPVAVQAVFSPIVVGQVYHYRLRATNASGDHLGEVRTFVNRGFAPFFRSKDVAEGADCTPFNHHVDAFDYDPDETPIVSLVSAPSWITLSETNGHFYLNANPTQQQTGVFPIVVQAKSGADVITQTITLTIRDLNHAPVFTSQAPSLGAIMRKGQSHSFTFSATDCDGDAITLRPASFPAWFTTTSNLSGQGSVTASFAGIPQEMGNYMIKMIATDGKAEATQGYSLQTTAQYIPLIVSTPPTALEAGKSFVYDLKAESDDGDLMLYNVEQAPDWLKLVCDGTEKWQCKSTSKAQLIGTPTAQDLAQNASVKIMILDDTPYSNLRSCQVFTFGTENGKSVVKDLKQTNCGAEVLANAEKESPRTTKALAEIPSEFVLLGNYPNPFNPSTAVVFNLPESAEITLHVFNTLGQRVKSISGQSFGAGANQRIELGMSDFGSGLYVYQLTAKGTKNTFHATGRMSLVK